MRRRAVGAGASVRDSRVPPVIPANAGIQESYVSIVTFARCANDPSLPTLSPMPQSPHTLQAPTPLPALSESVGLMSDNVG